MHLNIHKDIRDEIKAPVLLAGWPGMGHVGVAAISYLRSRLGAEPFAEIDMSEYLAPDSVVVENGLVEFPELPANSLFYIADPPLIFLESEVQIGGQPALMLMNELLDFAEDLGVSTIFTGAAYAMPVDRKEPIKVFGVANQEKLRDHLPPAGVDVLEEGQISGLNGILLGFAGLRHIPAACLLATLPQYAVNILNPKSSREIVRVLERLLNVNVDMEELEEAVTETEKTLQQIEDAIRKAISAGERPDEGEGEEWKQVEEEQMPQQVMENIERLFAQVKATGSKERAAELKRELDRWNLYRHYEDRFLNLFRSEEE